MITLEEIQEGLAEIIEGRKVKPDIVPDGWMTVEQLAKIGKRSYSQIAKLLRASVRDKSIPPPKKFRIKTKQGVFLVPHYFVVRK